MIRIDDVRVLSGGSKRSSGSTSRMGILEFVGLLLSVNETNSRPLKMTDESLFRRIVEEFPDQPSIKSMKEGRMKMSHWRMLYHSGKLTNGVKPKIRSRRYNECGDVISARSGRVLERGRSFGKELPIPFTAGFRGEELLADGGYIPDQEGGQRGG